MIQIRKMLLPQEDIKILRHEPSDILHVRFKKLSIQLNINTMLNTAVEVQLSQVYRNHEICF